MNVAIANLVPVLGWALLDFLWQGLLIGLLVLPLLGVLRHARPQARYALLMLALFACLCLPALAVLRGLAQGNTLTIASDSGFIAPQWLDDAGSAPTQAWQAQWQAYLPWIVAAWSLGASLLALRFALGFRWISRTRNLGRPPGFEWQARLERLSAAIGLSAPPALLIVQDLDSPAAAGWWRPVVLLPAALIANMPADLLEALLAHELAHVKRQDYLLNLLQGAVEVLLFYHPVVWWLSRQARIEREQIADDLATRATGQARPLALALQHLERMQAGLDHPFPDPQLAPAAHGGHLMNRIKRLLRPTPSSLHWKSSLSLIVVTALCLAVYAQASTHSSPAPAAAPRALAAAAPVARPSTVAAVAPVAAVEAPEPADAAAPVDPVEAVEPIVELEGDVIHARQYGGDRDSYALVRGGRESLLISGNNRDRSEVEHARDQTRGDFLWFRREGKSYIVRDPTLVTQASKAWAPAEALGAKMQALGDQMQPHSDRMEALSRKMQALAEQDEPQHRQMEAASRELEPIAERQREVAERMRDLSLRMVRVDTQADRDRLQREMDRLQAQLEPLNKQMSEISERLAEQSQRMETARLPMKQLSEQMQLSSEPMKALSEKMSVLAKQQERLSHQADAQVKQVIEQALRAGKAESGG